MIFEALTREEAVEKALAHFKCTEEDLIVKVLEKPRKKMMGLMKTPGRYEIAMKVEEKISEDENGTVEVSLGKIKVKNPRGQGTEASVLINHPQFSLLVNGEVKLGCVFLREEDEVNYKLTDIKPKVQVNLEFSEDFVTAFLKIDREKGKHYILEDLEKTHNATFTLIEEEIKTENVSVEECIQMLEEAGVLPEFINHAAIKKACEAEKSVRIAVAKGKEKVDSEATKINFCQEIFLKDFIGSLEPLIKRGTLLAEKVAEAKQGTPGIDLKGNDLNVSLVKDRMIEAGEWAVMKENKIYALKDGRPYLRNGTVGVVPLLTIVGDLDLDTDNIDFDGDVVVKGNVQDNMVIKATGNISVIGSVYHSELLAEQDVEILGKIIGGRIRAGNENSAFQVLLPLIERMIIITKEIFSGIRMEEGRDVQEVMNNIHEGKEKVDGVFTDIHEVSSLFDKTQMKMLEELTESYENCFNEIMLLRKEGFVMLNEIYERLYELESHIKEVLSDERIVKVVYAQNTTITSSGDIIINGEGSYQSNLSAGNEIRYENPDSVVRGGTLVAGKFIRAGLIGTPSEIKTFCKVLDKEGDIFGKFYKGTTLMIRDDFKKYTAIE